MNDKFDELYQKSKKYGQEHIFANYEKFSDEEKEKFIKQVSSIDFELMADLYEKTKKSQSIGNDKIEPMEYVDKNKLSAEEYNKLEKLGIEVIKKGGLAVVTMAGGQGTRLGHTGPKGTFNIGLTSNKSIFEILCDVLKEGFEKYGEYVNWYIMTSNENNKQTTSFFEQNNYFDYPKEKIKFFIQGELPAIRIDGKILLSEEGFIKMAADGHGGVFESMRTSGVIDDMKKKNIEWIFISGVDNILVKMVDPIHIGLGIYQNCMAVGKSVVKNSPDERVGVFCKRNLKPSVIEYTEISEEMANMRDEKGELLYGESHILCNLFNIKRLDKISENKLPYHKAFKKMNYMDENGQVIVATEPNAYKFEAFIFDAFMSLDSMAILRVNREEEFAPVKNKEGNDSPITAKKLYEDFHKIK